MFVITGATGRTGSVAAEALLSAGKRVRAVVRDARKAARLKDLGAELFEADLSDAAALARAVRGSEAVFLLSPPDLAAQNFIVDRKRLTQRQVNVLAEEKVPHVVLLSSTGSQHASGTGLIVSTHNAEEQLRASGLDATFVRAGFFVENWAPMLQPVRNDGVLPSFMAADRRVPSVSTLDIGRALAQVILDGPRGVRAIELSGPSDVSPKDVAATFARILGRPVQVVEAPLEAVVPTLISFGASENIAQLFREMYGAMASGKIVAEAGERMRGTTPLETTLRTLLG